MGVGSAFDLFAGIWDRFFSSKRKFINIRKKIERLEDEMSDLIKNHPSNDRTRARIAICQRKLRGMYKELELSAD